MQQYSPWSVIWIDVTQNRAEKSTLTDRFQAISRLSADNPASVLFQTDLSAHSLGLQRNRPNALASQPHGGQESFPSGKLPDSAAPEVGAMSYPLTLIVAKLSNTLSDYPAGIAPGFGKSNKNVCFSAPSPSTACGTPCACSKTLLSQNYLFGLW